MTGRLLRLSVIFLLLFAVNADAATSVPVIVKLLPGANISLITSVLGAVQVDSIPGANTYLLRLPSLPVLTPLLRLLGVEWIEANRGLSLPSVAHARLLAAPGATDPRWYRTQPAFGLIRSEAAHQYSDGSNVLIADINSSVDTSHPALVGHLFSGYDFVAGTPGGVNAGLNDDQQTAGFLDDDQQTAGFLDDDQQTAGFLDGVGASLFDDQQTAGFLDGHKPAYSHGTLCAGILVAVAPGAMIMPIRAFDDNGNSDVYTLAKAIRWAAEHNADVINMSFGTLDDTKILREAVIYARGKGVLLVASAGNNNSSTPQYPAAYSSVITVASTNLADQKASFSNYGTNIVVDAPGVDIISAYPGGGYAMASGTSFSAPEVAGEVALILRLRTTGVVYDVDSTAVNVDSRNPGYYGQLGYGRVDILRAVQAP
jgi:subtilisin family serine protease